MADEKLNVTCGSHHDYLGLHIDFSDRGTVTFHMIPYIKKIFTAFPQKITGVSSTPAADHLFIVCPAHESKILSEEQARAYYHTTAQFLFLSHICCNIQTTVAYLTTWVKTPNKDDWGKLKRVLKYLNSTRLLCLTLFAESLTNIDWYVDASHQTHDNCKGHTGLFLHLEKVPPRVHPTNRRYPLKAHLKAKLLPYTTNQVICSGHIHFLKLKDVISPLMLCFKTTWALYL